MRRLLANLTLAIWVGLALFFIPDASANSFSGHRLERRFKHNGNPAVQWAAYRGWRGCLDIIGKCVSYRLTLHKAVAWGHKGSGKRKKILWSNTWTTFKSSSDFNYQGIKARANRTSKDRSCGCEYTRSMRRGHFSLAELNFYPKIWMKVWSYQFLGGGNMIYGTKG